MLFWFLLENRVGFEVSFVSLLEIIFVVDVFEIDVYEERVELRRWVLFVV